MADLMYEGKAKKVFYDNDNVIIYYKDDATAFNGKKFDSLSNKGVLNNAITTIIYTHLHKYNIPTHFISKLSEREQLCKKVEIIPLEVIVRNVVAGSMAKRLGLEEGLELSKPVMELCYKKDELNDPLINDYHALALDLCTKEQLNTIYMLTAKVNDALKIIFKAINIKLIDFKLEFGVDSEGNVILADEISPDTCRLWDTSTNKKMDKDRFRRDLGDVLEAYQEILTRLENL